MAGNNQRVLSYGDVLLRERDVHTLLPGQWLNDNVIEFYLLFLCREVLTDSLRDEILLVGPSVTFWLLLCTNEEDIRTSLKPLKFLTRKVTISCVDNLGVETTFWLRCRSRRLTWVMSVNFPAGFSAGSPLRPQ